MSVRESHLRYKPERPLVRKRALQVVRKNKRGLIKRGTGSRIAPVLVVGAILLVATVFTVLLEQVLLAQTGFKMAQLRDRMVAEEAEHAELMLQAAKLGSSERIERYAIEHLGMVYPAKIEYIVADVRSAPAPNRDRASRRVLLGTEGMAAGSTQAAP